MTILLIAMLIPFAGDDELLDLQEVFVEAIHRAGPSVVTIETFGATDREGPTSGVILSADGEILTSTYPFHADPSAIIVTLPDGSRHAARRLGMDLSRGIALLKIDAGDLPLPRFARQESVRVGQWALALGRSFGGDRPGVQMGIVSALDRISGRAVQTDAPTSPANYGGALVDLEGKVLGVIVPLSPQGEKAAYDLYDSGIGFGIPIWQVRPVLHRLRRGEVLYPAFLGVVLDPARQLGSTVVTQVMPDSAAAGAGIQKGDEILRVGDADVRTSFEVQVEIGRRVADEAIPILLERDGREMTLDVRLGRRPEVPEEEQEE